MTNITQLKSIMQTLARQLILFYKQLTPPVLPKGIDILYPQPDRQVMKVVKQFFEKFYSDNKPRRLMMGINPGRFGAGITGVNFTAPRQLRENCGIDHPWGNSSELSAEFIYEMITAYGGPAKFYADYFIGAVSPLGYMKDGKNINYYDDKKLQQAVTPFIIRIPFSNNSGWALSPMFAFVLAVKRITNSWRRLTNSTAFFRK